MNHQTVIIFGNSGSGKSTLAKRMAVENDLIHLDLDLLAWLPTEPPQRQPLNESLQQLDAFVENNPRWVVEGCYADLLKHLAPRAELGIFMNLSIAKCQENAKNRPWEPHKYPSQQAQDANLAMLLAWIGEYENRDDDFSLSAHLALYNSLPNHRQIITENQP